MLKIALLSKIIGLKLFLKFVKLQKFLEDQNFNKFLKKNVCYRFFILYSSTYETYIFIFVSKTALEYFSEIVCFTVIMSAITINQLTSNSSKKLKFQVVKHLLILYFKTFLQIAIVKDYIGGDEKMKFVFLSSNDNRICIILHEKVWNL